jgi:hypothetical protein
MRISVKVSTTKGGESMLRRVLSVPVIVLLAVCVGCASPVAETHQGKVVTAGDGKLTMTDMAGGNQHAHEVASGATITCGGKTCGLAELKAGFTVTVTTEKRGESTIVTKIEAQEVTG